MTQRKSLVLSPKFIQLPRKNSIVNRIEKLKVKPFPKHSSQIINPEQNNNNLALIQVSSSFGKQLIQVNDSHQSYRKSFGTFCEDFGGVSKLIRWQNKFFKMKVRSPKISHNINQSYQAECQPIHSFKKTTYRSRTYRNHKQPKNQQLQSTLNQLKRNLQQTVRELKKQKKQAKFYTQACYYFTKRKQSFSQRKIKEKNTALQHYCNDIDTPWTFKIDVNQEQINDMNT